MASLESTASERLSLAEYEEALRHMPRPFVEAVTAAWGAPEADAAARDGAFSFSILRAGNFCLALQPDRGSAHDRKAQYHDGALPPRHAYVAFYVWLRRVAAIDAMIHCGAHGTLEWLPGKAAALSEDCAPEVVLGPTPVVYPFIVNNPGEAAQAKRRLSAVIIGHLTPPLTQAGAHGAAQEIEALLDEYASAQSLDPKRARLLAKAILERAAETGLAQDCGLKDDDDPIGALQRLDAWLCDLKDMRIGDGLHVFGEAPQGARREANLACLIDASACASAEIADALDRCGDAERAGLIAALDGRFVAAGTRRRALARAHRRAANGAQSLWRRSARGSDPHRLGDRPARGARSAGAPCARPWRMAKADRDGPLGQRDHAHRRRRSRPRPLSCSARGRSGTPPRPASPASRSSRWPSLAGRAST